jgi:hypothetical protein
LTYGHWPPTPKCNGPLHISTKTVYDPNVVSEQSVKELGYRIFKEGMEMPLKNVTTTNQHVFKVTFGGKDHLGYMDLNGDIKSWFLKK